MQMEFDTSALWQLVRTLDATEVEFRRALGSTTMKMARWLRGRSTRGLSELLQIMQKVLRKRLGTYRARPENGIMAAKVWYGLNPVPFSRLHPKQDSEGVTADGGRTAKGAFITSAKGRLKVLKRVSKARLPVEEVKADIDDPGARYIESVLERHEFEAKFLEIFERELKWRVSTR